MNLSQLQKYILRQCLESQGHRIAKKKLLNFYQSQKVKPQAEDQIGIITKSADRLIDKGLIRGGGIKTKNKWFVAWVSLTPSGRKKAKQLFGRQQELPLKNKMPKS